METEATDKYNKGLSEITDMLYSLRRVEFSSQSAVAKYNEAYPLIRSVTSLLAAKKNFLLFRPMWEELHDRMVYYYDFLNKENLDQKIPLFRDTLHNELVKWWLKCKKCSSHTLIHFDTHDDMGLPNDPYQVLKKDGTLNEDGISKGSCGKIFWPVTCMLLSKGVNHVIWAMPKWAYDDNAGFDQVLVQDGQGLIYLRDPGQKTDKFRIAGDVEIAEKGVLEKKSKFKFYHPHRLDRMHMHTAASWKKLGSAIKGPGFILDIDLDYFVCNGDKYPLAEYKKDFDDLESDGRVHGVPGAVTPRTVYSDDVGKQYVKNLNNEMSSIKKRIDTFLSGLYALQKMGLAPSCISISDSTPSFFSGNSLRAVFTNQYTPKYFVPIIHTLLIAGLREIYGKNAFY